MKQLFIGLAIGLSVSAALAFDDEFANRITNLGNDLRNLDNLIASDEVTIEAEADSKINYRTSWTRIKLSESPVLVAELKRLRELRLGQLKAALQKAERTVSN